jgi:hypothetical protein
MVIAMVAKENCLVLEIAAQLAEEIVALTATAVFQIAARWLNSFKPFKMKGNVHLEDYRLQMGSLGTTRRSPPMVDMGDAELQ